MTASANEVVEFTPRQRRELKAHAGLSEHTIAELQTTLNMVKDFESAEPTARRQMQKEIEALVGPLQAAMEAIDQLSPWTATQIRSRAYHCGADILPHELRHNLEAYRAGAFLTMTALAATGGRKTGPDPEAGLHVASAVRRVLDRAGVALSAEKKGPLALTIAIAFEAFGIKKGSEATYYAEKVYR